MTSGGTPAGTMGGARQPTWKERENNKRRERRRRAVAAKIFAGLRAYGNYELPKHCDNNEVLKALCREAGWTVEEDGTTYRKGCKPVERMDVAGPSASPSPCSSYQPSPCTSYQPSPCASYNPSPRASYNPSPASSSLQSPASYVTNANNTSVEPSSLLPWLKNLSSSSSSASSKVPHHLRHLYVHGGSISAPVTPPLSSPTARTPPQIKTDWDESTAPPSPGGATHQDIVPDPAAWFAGIQIASAGPSSPTFSLVSSNPFGGGSSSRMWTPGQSGTCSPAMPGGSSPAHVDVHMSDCASDEFAFGSSSNGTPPMTGLVKAWEGERIHEECVSDELELTLGNSSTRAD